SDSGLYWTSRLSRSNPSDTFWVRLASRWARIVSLASLKMLPSIGFSSALARPLELAQDLAHARGDDRLALVGRGRGPDLDRARRGRRRRRGLASGLRARADDQLADLDGHVRSSLSACGCRPARACRSPAAPGWRRDPRSPSGPGRP